MKIKNLRKSDYDDSVFWTVEHENSYGEIVEEDLRTNQEDEGMFHDTYNWRYRQIWGCGTCQFQLKQKTLSGIRRALYRYFGKED